MVSKRLLEIPQQGGGRSFWKPSEQESGVDLPIVPALSLSAGKAETETIPQHPG